MALKFQILVLTVHLLNASNVVFHIYVFCIFTIFFFFLSSAFNFVILNNWAKFDMHFNFKHLNKTSSTIAICKWNVLPPGFQILWGKTVIRSFYHLVKNPISKSSNNTNMQGQGTHPTNTAVFLVTLHMQKGCKI